MSKASLSHFKLTVEDSVKLARLYRDVFGMKEVERFDALDADDPHLEIHLSAGREEDDNKIALVHYSNRPAPTPGEATIGFIVEDVDAVVAAALVAGGVSTRAAETLEDYKARYAVIADPEGHSIEITQSMPNLGAR